MMIIITDGLTVTATPSNEYEKATKTYTTAAVPLAAIFILASFAAIPARGLSYTIHFYGSGSGGWGFGQNNISSPGPTIHLQQGASVTMTLHSVDGARHNFFIDLNDNGQPDANEPKASDFTGVGQVSFTIDQASTYEYYCQYHPLKMKGEVIVHASSSTGDGQQSASGDNTPLIVGGVIAIAAIASVILGLRARAHREKKK